MKQGQLTHIPPRRWRMKQPQKSVLRWELELARAQFAYASTPRLWRLGFRLFARVVETDKQTAAEQAALERV